MPMNFPEAPPPVLMVVEDTGIAWGMGTLGGGVFAGVKGFRNSPRGDKLAGGWMNAKVRGPIYGGNFAIWGGLYTMSDLLLQRARGASDGYNSVLAGALTGGALAARAGFKQFYRNAAIGGVLLGVIEGFSTVMGAFKGQAVDVPGPIMKEVLSGYYENSDVDWSGRKSNFRAREPMRDMPKGAPRWVRNFRAKWDGMMGPWGNTFPDDPISLWSGRFVRSQLRRATMAGERGIKLELPTRANLELVRVAKLRDQLWDESQAALRARRRFEIDPQYSATPPAVPVSPARRQKK